jgi:hypothetical protein
VCFYEYFLFGTRQRTYLPSAKKYPANHLPLGKELDSGSVRKANEFVLFEEEGMFCKKQFTSHKSLREG